MPKGRGFVEYEALDAAYEALRSATRKFTMVTPEIVMQ